MRFFTLSGARNRRYVEQSLTVSIVPNGLIPAMEPGLVACDVIEKSIMPLEQQLCVFLKEVYEFKVSEITTIPGTTEPMVKYYLHTGRLKMINIFEGRALINKEGV
jgi:RNA polymerase sigma-70 factor (ECF subfamily)